MGINLIWCASPTDSVMVRGGHPNLFKRFTIHYAATTIMELRAEMYHAAELLKEECKTQQVSLASACELFLRFVTRVDLLSVAVCVAGSNGH